MTFKFKRAQHFLNKKVNQKEGEIKIKKIRKIQKVRNYIKKLLYVVKIHQFLQL